MIYAVSILSGLVWLVCSALVAISIFEQVSSKALSIGAATVQISIAIIGLGFMAGAFYYIIYKDMNDTYLNNF